MPRTVFSTRSPYRAGLAGVAVVVLLTACGGDDGGSGAAETTRAAGGDSAETTDASEVDEFCSQAAGLDQRVDSALSDLEGGDPSVVDAFRQIATELRGIPAPAAISSDWTAVAAGLDRMADAFADIDDITDLDSLQSLDEAEGNMAEASARVEQYLDDECGG
jgi:hypothetical protein